MDLLGYLNEQLANVRSISDTVTIFEQMSTFPTSSEIDDLLFETGVYPDYTALTESDEYKDADLNLHLAMLKNTPKNFQFSLVRQYRRNDWDDEFLQLRLDIYLKPELWNKLLYVSFWSNNDIPAFFRKVRASLAYKYIEKHNLSISNIKVSLTET